MEIPTKQEFDDWLRERHIANQVPVFHLTSPVPLQENLIDHFFLIFFRSTSRLKEVKLCSLEE